MLRIILFTPAIFCLYLAFRNTRIYLYRANALRGTWLYSTDTIDYLNRVGQFDKVSYDRMLFHFWVWPLSKFYPDTSFMKKGAVNGQRKAKRKKQKIGSNP